MITYRLEKGAPLTILELDTNFRELEERLAAREDNISPLIISAEQQDDVVTFKVNGDAISHVVLPKFQPLFKGAWQRNATYQSGCWVYVNAALYACQTYHTSSDFFEPTYWQLIFDSKGEANA